MVERWILARLRIITVFSIDQLNAAISKLLIDLNERPFEKLPGSRRSLFEQIEKDKLIALPSKQYVYQHIRFARVHIDYHIEYDKHYYSVPHILVGQQVEVRACATMISVFAGGKRIACHARSHCKTSHTTLTEHMPQTHRHQASWSSKRFASWAKDIGPCTACVVDTMLTKKRHLQQSFRSVLALFSLVKQFDRVRLENACKRALAIGSPTRTSVHSILKKGRDGVESQSSDANQSSDAHLSEHNNARGSGYYS